MPFGLAFGPLALTQEPVALFCQWVMGPFTHFYDFLNALLSLKEILANQTKSNHQQSHN